MEKKNTFHKAPVIQTHIEGTQKHTSWSYCTSKQWGLYEQWHRLSLCLTSQATTPRCTDIESVCETNHFKLNTAMDTPQTVHNHLHKSSRETKRDDEILIIICKTKGGYKMRNRDQITEKFIMAGLVDESRRRSDETETLHH